MTPPRNVPAWVREIADASVQQRKNYAIDRYTILSADLALTVPRLLSALGECVEALRTIRHLHEIIPEGLPDVGFCVSCGTVGPCSAKRLADRVLARHENGEIGR